LAAEQLASTLRQGGILIASVRDYDRILAVRPRAELPRVIDGTEGRRIVFQVWDWQADGRTYVTNLFIVREIGGSWATSHYATPYHAIRRDELADVLRRAGFGDVRWSMPDESGFFQPLVSA